ncbi:hypothetical protein BV22DRAFT_1050925 [Leucogyrophana mollusca]|uniref:Uncharacterized protein n=1 Tax=Leucogyrophana mollusca TaxID=85980 RepID=A0ACB8B1I1_9AGAM|nr:hypothetical protein BV22DRAFT_1050925 [Leucogyrophana mollusca]
MKAEFSEEVAQFCATHRRGVKKADFTGTFGRSFLRAFTPELIKSAFCMTGVHPLSILMWICARKQHKTNTPDSNGTHNRDRLGSLVVRWDGYTELRPGIPKEEI